MTTTLFLYLLLFQVPGAVSDPNGHPAGGAKVACGSETKTTDPREVSDFRASARPARVLSSRRRAHPLR